MSFPEILYRVIDFIISLVSINNLLFAGLGYNFKFLLESSKFSTPKAFSILVCAILVAIGTL